MKILFVNFMDYIPMGTFGICDYLEQNNIKARILTINRKPINEYLEEIKELILRYTPSHIGLIFHWKECLEHVIYIGNTLKNIFPKNIFISGGFTAGYFRENLFKIMTFLDIIVVGDPEVPIKKILKGERYQFIPNIIYRNNENEIKINKVSYYVSSKEISKINYTNIDYLINYNEYLENIYNKVGFPIFIGRGCQYNCKYCGGSKTAYKKHSNRKNIVFRDVDAVINDLLVLKKYINYIYIGFDNDKKFIKDLLKGIISKPELCGYYYFCYSAWELLDKEMIILLKKAFRYDSNKYNTIEISPEVYDEKARAKVKDKRLFYKNKKLIENVDLINSELKNIIIELYFSRYHPIINSSKYLSKEFMGIVDILNYYYGKNNIRILYGHLSSDPGSIYWKENYKDNRSVDYYLMKVINNRKNYLINNIIKHNDCIIYPENLTNLDIINHEKIIMIHQYFIMKKYFKKYYDVKNPKEYMNILKDEIKNIDKINKKENSIKIN